MHLLRYPTLLVSCLLCLAARSSAGAKDDQTLTMDSGDHLRGECVEVTEAMLTWRTTYGDKIRVPVSAVSELTCGEAWDLQFSDGQTLRGQWSVSHGTLTLRSTVFGTLRCPVSELQTGTRAVSGRGLTSENPSVPIIVAEPPAAPRGPAAPAPATDEAPPSSLQTMLRQSSILLRPGAWSFSTGLNYTHDRALFSPNETRQVGVINQLQYGFSPKVEGSIDWPATWARTTTTLVTPTGGAPTITSASSSKLQVGDPELGGAALLLSEGRIRPECVVVGGLTIPVNRASEGGVFRSRIGLEFLKTSDPGALFCGFGWLHDGGGWQSSPFKPQDRFTYHIGAAIGLNDELALGFQAQGVFTSALRTNSGTLLSFSQEAVQGRFWFNFRLDQQTFLEASVLLPMSPDAHATTFGLTYIRRY